jgi:hypothetical protein
MGLRETIKAGARTAFNVLGDIKESVTYKAHNAGVYDRTTGKQSESWTNYSIEAIFDGFNEVEVNPTSDIRFGDLKVMFLNVNVFTPKSSDVVVRDGNDYEVIGVQTDPAKAVWILQARKK